MALRALATVATLALAACVAPASQQGAQSESQAEAQSGSQVAQPAMPASPATHPATHRLRTGGPNPPQRVEDTCKVDADCADKPHCEGVDCRCVETQCIAPREAIEPSIDPAPATSVR